MDWVGVGSKVILRGQQQKQDIGSDATTSRVDSREEGPGESCLPGT